MRRDVILKNRRELEVKNNEFGNVATKKIYDVLSSDPVLLEKVCLAAKVGNNFELRVRRYLYYFANRVFWKFSGNWDLINWGLLEARLKEERNGSAANGKKIK